MKKKTPGQRNAKQMLQKVNGRTLGDLLAVLLDDLANEQIKTDNQAIRDKAEEARHKGKPGLATIIEHTLVPLHFIPFHEIESWPGMNEIMRFAIQRGTVWHNIDLIEDIRRGLAKARKCARLSEVDSMPLSLVGEIVGEIVIRERNQRLLPTYGNNGSQIKMKAITIAQPYAHLISTGEKRVENRKWSLQHRGPIAIHAGKSKAWLHTYSPLPANMVYGAIIAVADVTHCIRIDDIRAGEIPAGLEWIEHHQHASGPFCWVLANVRVLAESVAARGQMGLWDVDATGFRFK